MSPRVKQKYLAYMEDKFRGSQADRRAHAIYMGLMIILAIGGGIMLIVSLTGDGKGAPFSPLALVAAVMGFSKHYRRTQAYQRNVAEVEKYRPVWTTLVQANAKLFQPGSQPILPCLVIFSFDENRANNQYHMADIAQHLFTLKQQSSSPQPDVQKWIAFMHDERAVPYRRVRLPDFVTGGGSPVYVADLYIRRSDLREGYLTGRRLPCMAEPGDQGKLQLIPWHIVQEEPEAAAMR